MTMGPVDLSTDDGNMCTGFMPASAPIDPLPAKSRSCWLTVPELYRLDSACARLQVLYPFQVYLVGSVLERRDYRDVDIRLLLSDKKWSRHTRREWLFFNAAISDQLNAATGLPIDFQFMSRTEWDEYKDRPVRPLGHLPRRNE